MTAPAPRGAPSSKPAAAPRSGPAHEPRPGRTEPSEATRPGRLGRVRVAVPRRRPLQVLDRPRPADDGLAVADRPDDRGERDRPPVGDVAPPRPPGRRRTPARLGAPCPRWRWWCPGSPADGRPSTGRTRRRAAPRWSPPGRGGPDLLCPCPQPTPPTIPHLCPPMRVSRRNPVASQALPRTRLPCPRLLRLALPQPSASGRAAQACPPTHLRPRRAGPPRPRRRRTRRGLRLRVPRLAQTTTPKRRPHRRPPRRCRAWRS